MSIFFIFFSLGFWIWEVSDFQDIKKLAIFFTSLIASISVTIIFNLLMPSKTEKGVQMKEYLLGLREYLKVAEEDRIKFHNAPEKRPEVFEALLPYAIVFGVEKQWAKEFEEIYKNQPEWFESKNSSFNINTFGKEISIFNTVLTASISSNPNSKIGIGGNGVGSGHGGGGGGSW
jgi:uncharacterized membrane protein